VFGKWVCNCWRMKWGKIWRALCRILRLLRYG